MSCTTHLLAVRWMGFCVQLTPGLSSFIQKWTAPSDWYLPVGPERAVCSKAFALKQNRTRPHESNKIHVNIISVLDNNKPHRSRDSGNFCGGSSPPLGGFRLVGPSPRGGRVVASYSPCGGQWKSTGLFVFSLPKDGTNL